MTKEEKKAANKLLEATDDTLRHLSVALDSAHYCAGNLRTSIKRLNDAHPESLLCNFGLDIRLAELQADIRLQEMQLANTEEHLFPGRRAKRQRECDERNQDRRTEQMEKYAGYTGE